MRPLPSQIFEPSAKRTFLKRCEPPEAVKLEDFFVGATLTLFSRQFKILAFGDAATERRLKLARSSTLGIVTSDALANLGSILQLAVDGGFTIGRLAMLNLTPASAGELVASRAPAGMLRAEGARRCVRAGQFRGRGWALLCLNVAVLSPLVCFHMTFTLFPRCPSSLTSDKRRLVSSLTSGPVVAVELVGEDAVYAWHNLMGPSDPADARAALPDSIRAKYGRSAAANAVHGSSSPEDAEKDIATVFGGELTYTATYRCVRRWGGGSVLDACCGRGRCVVWAA